MYRVTYQFIHCRRPPSLSKDRHRWEHKQTCSLSLSPTQNHSFVFLIFSISEDIFHSLFASAVDHSYFAAEVLLSHPSDVSPLPQPLDVEDSVEFVVINFSKATLGPSSQVQKKATIEHFSLDGLTHYSWIFVVCEV